jgi:L-ascorbate metabolism protein UlaG (beta-lactamase superfamily)
VTADRATRQAVEGASPDASFVARGGADFAAEGFHHVGHSTHLLALEGLKILTDPWITEPADRCLWHDPAPAPLPTDVDLVLITHAHGDHFDPGALSRIDRGATVIVPEQRLAEAIRELRFARVLAPVDDGPLLFGPVKVRAPEGRHLVPERVFHVEGARGAVFFGGDTERTPQLDAFAADHPAAFAILPAERSTILGRRSVMPPEDARAVADRLRATRCVLTHHESRASRRHPLGWLVKIDVARDDELDARFVRPRPGDFVAFPWNDRAAAAGGGASAAAGGESVTASGVAR